MVGIFFVLLAFTQQSSIPAVLDCIVCSAWKQLGNLTPSVGLIALNDAFFLVRNNNPVFFLRKWGFVYIRVQLVVPPELSLSVSCWTLNINSSTNLSLHCFDFLPGRWPAMNVHFFAPCSFTSMVRLSSSC